MHVGYFNMAVFAVIYMHFGGLVWTPNPSQTRERMLDSLHWLQSSTCKVRTQFIGKTS